MMVKQCIKDCLREFGTGLGWIAFPIAVLCILLAIIPVLVSGGLLALPAIFVCLAAAGMAYTATAVGGCIFQCIRDLP